MSLPIREIIEWLEELAPPSLALHGDKIGLQVGSRAAAVSRVLTSLDVTEEVVEEAVRLDAQLIVAHHAVLFHPLHVLIDDDHHSALAMKLVRAGVNVYIAHTNLDAAVGGINDQLASRLGLINVRALTQPVSGNSDGIGRIGCLATVMPLAQFAIEVRDRLGVERVRYVGRPEQQVGTVAVVGGAGASYMDQTLESGADCLVTGDLKYHDALEAYARGFALVDPGHNGSERFIANTMRDFLTRKAVDCGRALHVLASKVSTEPFRFA